MRRVGSKIMKGGTVSRLLQWRQNQQEADMEAHLAKELSKVSGAARAELDRMAQARADATERYTARLAALQGKLFQQRHLPLKRAVTSLLSSYTRIKPGYVMPPIRRVKLLMIWACNTQEYLKKAKDLQYNEAGIALTKLGDMLDQAEIRTRQLELAVDKEKVKKRQAEKAADDAEAELALLLSKSRLEDHEQMLETVR